MKTLALISLSLAVALGMPHFVPGEAQNPVLTEEDQIPLLADWVPVQGHVVEDPAPPVRPDVKVQPEDTVEPEVKEEIKVKEKPDVKEEPDVKVEPDVKEEPDVKVEPEMKEETDVKEEPVVKEEPDVKVEPEMKEETDVKEEPVVKEEPEVKEEPDVKEEPVVKEEPDVKVQPEDTVEPEVKEEPDVKEEPVVKEEPEVKVEPDVKEAPLEPEISYAPDFKVESEVKVEPDVQGNPQVQMNLEEEAEKRHIDMARKYETMGQPIMELELLDDDNTELSDEEKTFRAEFNNENAVNHPLPEEGEGPIMELEPLDDDNIEKSLRAEIQNEDPEEGAHVLNGGPIMELEPEEEIPDDAVMKGPGPALDTMGQQRPSLEEYFPNEEARMGMAGMMEGPDYLMLEEPGSEFVREEGEEEEELSALAPFEESQIKDSPVLDRKVQSGVSPKNIKQAVMKLGFKNPEETLNQDMQGQSHCAGVRLEEKCYHFFKGPKRAADAEFFCQEHFAGGHLASITSQHIHREVMNMMLQQNGVHTRAWIGGLRYLETGRFIWLDGSLWSYADWLSGEPNNTADVEHCVEVLGHGNGKFNDFTCWEPQAFICSYPYE